jgi:Uma2 family endonuclease
MSAVAPQSSKPAPPLPAGWEGPMTFDEYLRRERVAEFKHEYRDGYMVPIQGPHALPVNMSGGKFGHSKLKTNLIGELHKRLKGKSCQPLDSDFKIHIPGKGKVRGIYPDASIFCGPVDCLDDEKDVGLNPTALFEVLSPSTEAYDRGVKFASCQRLASLKLYVLIAQDQHLVEVYRRDAADGTWLYTAHMGVDAVASLPDIGIDLPLADLYENVEFPPYDPAAIAKMYEEAAAYRAY